MAQELERWEGGGRHRCRQGVGRETGWGKGERRSKPRLQNQSMFLWLVKERLLSLVFPHEWEGNHISDTRGVCKQHDQAVDANTETFQPV
eukprot:768431-Hanusia_phi.AAC.8